MLGVAQAGPGAAARARGRADARGALLDARAARARRSRRRWPRPCRSTCARDVPLAVLLSGGLDSSLVASLAAAELDEPLRTFTVGFDDAALRRARAGARGRARDRLASTASSSSRRTSRTTCPRSPRGSSSRSPTPPRSRSGTSAAPSRAEVKVALAGDGGDEVFGGYSRYAWDPVAARLGALRAARAASCPERGGRKNVVRRASKLLRHAAKDEPARYLSWFALMDGDARTHVFDRLFAEAPDAPDGARPAPVGRPRVVRDGQPDAEGRQARAWPHSLELRVPLLDHRVVEAGSRAPRPGEGARRARRRSRSGGSCASGSAPSSPGGPSRGSTRRSSAGCDGELRDLAGDAIASLDGLVDRSAVEAAGPAQRYALTMLALWRAGLESRARELVRH